MAINTKQKRMTAINVMCPWRGLLKEPSGGIGSGLRQGIAFLYSGIVAGIPVLIASAITYAAELYKPLLHDSRVGKHQRRKRIVYVR